MAILRVERHGPTWRYIFEMAPVDGKRKKRCKGGFRTKGEASKAGQEAFNLYLNSGTVQKPCNMSVADFINDWYRMNESQWKPATKRGYRKQIDNYIIPKLGHYKLTSLNVSINRELYWLYCWGKVYSGYSALLGELGFDGTRYQNEAALEVRDTGGSNFSTSAYAANWGWGSARYNCALQGIAWRSGDSSLQEAAKHQMDCILQSNTAFKSYLVGFGDSYPLHYHHRAANPGDGNPASNTEAKYILYGALLGGPDASGSYEDKQNSYTCTEPALDYNGCFVLAIAPLVSKYGGDLNEAKAVIKNASEINETFDFGGQSVIETTTSTTTTTTVTTEPFKLMLGDADCNQSVNVVDAVLIARVVADDSTLKVGEITDEGKRNSDMDQNGRVEKDDLTILLSKLAHNA